MTGLVVGKRKMTLKNAVQVHAQTFIYHDALPKLIGPGVKWEGQNIWVSNISKGPNLAQDRDTITPIHGNGTYVKNGRDGGVACQID